MRSANHARLLTTVLRPLYTGYYTVLLSSGSTHAAQASEDAGESVPKKKRKIRPQASEPSQMLFDIIHQRIAKLSIARKREHVRQDATPTPTTNKEMVRSFGETKS